MPINEAWHRQHVMPRNATLEQRLTSHRWKEMMLHRHVSHVVVTENGRPIGVIARHDLVRALASERQEGSPRYGGYV